MTKEIITLLSLDDLAEANIIKSKLETEGIACFMNNSRKSLNSKSSKPIDIRVYMQDLDKALHLIEEDAKKES